jgi:hypothetical protein
MSIPVKRRILLLLALLLACPALLAHEPNRQEPNRNICFGMSSPWFATHGHRGLE